MYYTYSGEISFTTLRSARSASSKTQDRTIHEDLVACSPKSMYRLADKVRCLFCQQESMTISPETLLKQPYSMV